ncbi:hypothetical protein ICW40_06195 [Actinotalea ferrariae]|uniref:DUF5709 domain-containing protein n=1 Tax=Actinotalea ferrariae TaxID=1386098 RepID=UPI001ED1A73D|nr:DUF5709 domain-containing protein [Actinotalea ferrariae]MBX9244396.1 hypothetical protein [Actinotalea ferrariae]
MSTYGDTSATMPDPESAAEGDTNQLQQDDTLLDRGVDSILDEGYSPPERQPAHHRLETELEQLEGESMDERLAQEVPDVWETQDEPSSSSDEPDRAGRLAAAESEASGAPAESVIAQDVGIAGSAATAEEAAVHVIDEEVDARGASADDGETPPAGPVTTERIE